MSAIREATEADIPTIVRLGGEFLAYSVHKEWPLDEVAFGDFVARLIDGGGVVFLSSDGMLGGLLNRAYFNPGVVLGAELFWWAREGGTALRLAFEEWCRARGAHGVNFTGMRDGRSAAIDRVFARAGYAPTETGYFKRF